MPIVRKRPPIRDLRRILNFTGRGKGIYFKGPHAVTLAIIIAFFGLLSVALYVLYRIVRGRRDKTPISTHNVAADNLLRKYAIELQVEFLQSLDGRFSPSKPLDLSRASSFGCYFGDLTLEGITKAERRILVDYDIIVLDQKRRVDVNIRSLARPEGVVLARLELQQLAAESGYLSRPTPTITDLKNFLRLIFLNISSILNAKNGGLFDGILVCDFDSLTIQDTFLQLLSETCFKFLYNHGIIVFLQLQPPLFGENRITDLTHLNGIVLTNVTINPSGEPKDFFDIPSRLWEIIKMSNTQISYRSDFCSVILEFVDDIDGHETSKTLSPAQKSRLFKVSQFYRAIASYVTSTGLTNADYNLPLDRPAGILDVMSWPTYQECRRRWLDHLKKRSICAGPATNSSLSMISNILKVDTPSVISYDLEVGAIETLDVNNYSIEVQSLMECATTAAQHFLHSHPAADDLFKIRALQTDLMTRGLLRPFTSIELGNIMKDFDSVMDENCINLGTLKVDLLQFMTSGNVRVWSSLHSGLALSSKVSTNHLALRFWSVWDVIRDGDRHAFHIFVSLNHPRPAEAVLHSFLASKGYSYEQATEAEMGLSRDASGLPRRVAAEIAQSTPSELLSLLHWSTTGPITTLKTKVGEEVERILAFECDGDFERLYGGLTVLQLDALPGLVDERLKELSVILGSRHRLYAVHMPSKDDILDMMEKARQTVRKLLAANDLSGLENLLQALKCTLSERELLISGEWIAFSVFSAFKLEAYDEIKTCVNDFNPLPAPEPDQQALMSELYVLGTRCDEFFDLGIHRLSQKLYYDRMLFLNTRQPDTSSYHPRKLMFMYRPLIHSGPMEVRKNTSKLPWKSFGASIVFAIPALTDLTLLLGTGFGIFVNVRMSIPEQRSLTWALLYSLLATGVFNPVLSYSGTYYLFLFQFPSMGNIMLRQFVGICLCIWIIAFIFAIIISLCTTIYAGLIFMYYSIVYPIYFLGLGIMATIYSEDMPIASGRRIAWISVPLVILYWGLAYIGNSKDYQMMIHSAFWGVLSIMCMFVFTKYLRRLSGWLSEVLQTDDKAVSKWYATKYGHLNPAGQVNKKESYLTEVARRQLEKEVLALSHPSFSQCVGGRKDEYVMKLANSFAMTKFLLQWHSRHLDYDLPVPYGLEWNLNVKLALQEMEKLNKASTIHRPRMFWNMCKWEMGYGLLFFILLLMDRWIVLLSGSDILGLVTIQNPQYGIGQGCAMLFFLVSTIPVELLSRRIWSVLSKKDLRNNSFSNSTTLAQRLKERSARRRRIYYEYLLILGSVCSILFCLVALYVWNMSTGWTSVFVFCALSFGYFALIWMTYTKSFCPSNSKRVVVALLSGSIVGLCIGVPLHYVVPQYYPEQVSLVVSQWIAAILVCRAFWMDVKHSAHWESSGERFQSRLMTGMHRISLEHTALTEREVKDFTEMRLEGRGIRLQPHGPLGHAVFRLLKEVEEAENSETYCKGIGHAIRYILENWGDVGKLQVNLVDESVLASVHQRSLLGISWKKEDVQGRDSTFIVYVGVPSDGRLTSAQLESIAQHSDTVKSICEVLLHEAIETLEGLRHDDAVASELAVSRFKTSIESDEMAAPARVVREMEMCGAARLRLLQLRTREYVVKGLCFSADMDVMWPKLSRKLRTYFISRVKGKELEMGASERQELSTFFSADLPHLRTISSHLVLLALSIGKLSQRRLSANPSQGVQFNFQTPEPDDDDEADTIGNSSALQHALNRFGELFLGLLMGDSQLPRNLASSTRSYNVAWRWAVVRMFLFAASGFRKVVWRATQRLLWEGNETLSALRRTANRQTKRVITKDYIQIHSPLRPETAFLYSQDPQKLVYNHYKGILPKQPLSRKQMIAITEYDIDYTLKRKEVWKNLEVREKIVFTYAPVTKKLREVPLKKDIYDKNGTHHSTYYYAKGDGRVTHAHFNRDGLLFNASYIYWSPESFEILEIHYLVPQLSLIVKLHFYTITHDKIPTSTLQRIVCEKLRPTDPVHHPRHHTAIAHLEMPELTARPTDAWWTTTTFKLDALARRVPTTLLQSKTETVAMVTPRLLVEMERMGLLGYPDEEMLHFHVENPFFFHRRGERKWWGRQDVNEVLEKRLRLGTAKARTALWKKWLGSSEVHGVWVRMIDEVLLREEPLLKRYWSLRDKGDHKSARRYLLTNEPSIHAILHIDQDVSSRCHLAIRFQDLYMMGNGGDARRIMPVMAAPISLDTRRSNTELWREREFVRVLELATGTWPSSSGGVSNCIRDVVDGLESVRWTVLAENAHDLELILSQFQIERNVESLLMLPLWGFDGLEPMHDFNGTLPDSTLALRVFSTTPSRIRIFISILHRLIDACIATPHNLPSPIPITIAVHTKTDLAAATHAFVEYYRFFRKCDYGAVWSHPEVWKCWIGRWTEAIKGGELEWPTVDDMREAMDYFKRTLFCLTVAFPDPMPDVIQSSHHAIGSIYGVVGKMITGKPLLVWDHGILWREYLGHWSSSESTSPPAHHTLLLTLARLVSTLTLHHADAILPCTRFSNPIWETWRMSGCGQVFSSNEVMRKIEPVVNGIVDVEDFFPDHTAEKAEGKFWVVMLSHIVTFKDIKNAILAADVIVNKFGIKAYQLDIYGSTDKTPWYTYECTVLIHVTGLQDHVKIRGFGDSKFVLNSAWLVLNSSIAEGLPLALGEAGLCGQPIVCTEAGGSREVIQIRVPKPGSTGSNDEGKEEEIAYIGRSVSPSNPYELAVAQLAVLGVFDDLEDVATGKRREVFKRAAKEFGGVRVDSGAVVDADAIGPANTEEEYSRCLIREPEIMREEVEERANIREWIAAGRFEDISKRIFDKKKERRELGLCLRRHVLDKFSGERYLREHEQMLHIGSFQASVSRDDGVSATPVPFSSTNTTNTFAMLRNRKNGLSINDGSVF